MLAYVCPARRCSWTWARRMSFSVLQSWLRCWLRWGGCGVPPPSLCSGFIFCVSQPAVNISWPFVELPDAARGWGTERCLVPGSRWERGEARLCPPVTGPTACANGYIRNSPSIAWTSCLVFFFSPLFPTYVSQIFRPSVAFQNRVCDENFLGFFPPLWSRVVLCT